MKRHEVTNCLACPFSELAAGEWLCGQSAHEGMPLKRIPARSLSNDRRPPRWCPLRRADHLVTLRVK